MPSASIVQMLQSAGSASTDATAYIVDPDTGEPTAISLTPRRPNGQVDYGPTRSQLAASITAVQRVLDDEAARGPFDLLTTIATAVRAAPPPATLIVLSSGLSTAGGLDMRQVGWDASPASVAARSVAGPGGTTTTIVPDTLLFQFGSSVLLPTADSILRPVVTQARDHDLRVSITGYASPDGGTTAYNIVLSERRAEAVSSRLRALGLPAAQIIEVAGAGTAGKSLAACLVHGQLDEAVCAQLRRVVITMSPVTASLN